METRKSRSESDTFYRKKIKIFLTLKQIVEQTASFFSIFRCYKWGTFSFIYIEADRNNLLKQEHKTIKIMKNNTQTMIKKTYKIHSLEEIKYITIEDIVSKITSEEVT
jgi:hypothetical protein